MVIPIEYMSDFVGLLPLDSNMSGTMSSGGDQRMVPRPANVDAWDVEVVEFGSPVILISPASARQAQPSSETRMFVYTKLSVVV